MSISGPLDLTLWRDRLSTQVSSLRKVGLAADLIAAREDIRLTPQAFVVPVSDQPTQQAGAASSVLSQRVTSIVAVVLAVGNKRAAASGSAASEELRPIRKAVMDALIGWKPADAEMAIQYSGGLSLAYQGSTVWWTDRFATSFFIRKDYS